MRCAACGREEDLCESMEIDGIKQPRICKDCLIQSMSIGEPVIQDDIWIEQIASLPNGKTMLKRLMKQAKK